MQTYQGASLQKLQEAYDEQEKSSNDLVISKLSSDPVVIKAKKGDQKFDKNISFLEERHGTYYLKKTLLSVSTLLIFYALWGREEFMEMYQDRMTKWGLDAAEVLNVTLQLYGSSPTILKFY